MRGRAPAFVGAVLLGVAIAVYVSLIGSEGEGFGTREVAVAVSLGVAAALGLVGAVARDAGTRAVSLAVAAALAFAWTVLGAASIGLLIALGALPLLVAAIDALRAVPEPTGRAILGAALLVAVLDVAVVLGLTA